LALTKKVARSKPARARTSAVVVFALVHALLAPDAASADAPMPGFMSRPLSPPPAGGVFVRSDDGRFVYRMSGFVHLQTDALFRPTDEDSPRDVDVSVRRARLSLESTVFSIVDARLLFDVAMDVVPLDAYVDLRAHRALNVRVGKFKSPLSLERLAPVFAVPFIERASLPTTLAPNRDFGVFVHGETMQQTFGYELALLGGADDLEVRNFYSGSPHVAGRLFVMPFRAASRAAPLHGLGFGFSATAGDSRVNDGSKLRLSVHGHYQLERFAAWFEYVDNRDGVGATDPSVAVRKRAWVAQTSVALTADENDFFGLRPRRPFNLRAGHVGAVALALRVHELRSDEPLGSDPEGAQSTPTWARAAGAALLWKPNHVFEWRVDVEHTRRRGVTSAGPARGDETAVRTRLEVRF
jgi:phosphate-selective porin OprO and OprP